jgi:hypothetical protein
MATTPLDLPDTLGAHSRPTPQVTHMLPGHGQTRTGTIQLMKAPAVQLRIS